MILLNDFFSIIRLAPAADAVHAGIRLNAHHPIYAGHFPQQPVFPGALMVQSIVEIMESVTGEALQLTAADSIKFLAVIDPFVNGEVEVSIAYTRDADRLNVDARLFAGTVIFFKLKATLTSV